MGFEGILSAPLKQPNPEQRLPLGAHIVNGELVQGPANPSPDTSLASPPTGDGEIVRGTPELRVHFRLDQVSKPETPQGTPETPAPEKPNPIKERMLAATTRAEMLSVLQEAYLAAEKLSDANARDRALGAFEAASQFIKNNTGLANGEMLYASLKEIAGDVIANKWLEIHASEQQARLQEVLQVSGEAEAGFQALYRTLQEICPIKGNEGWNDITNLVLQINGARTIAIASINGIQDQTTQKALKRITRTAGLRDIVQQMIERELSLATLAGVYAETLARPTPTTDLKNK